MQAIKVDNATGTITPFAAVTGKVVRIFGTCLVMDSSTSVNVKSNTTSLTGAMAGITSLVLDVMGERQRPVVRWQSAAGEAINLILGGAVQCSGTVYADQVPSGTP